MNLNDYKVSVEQADREMRETLGRDLEEIFRQIKTTIEIGEADRAGENLGRTEQQEVVRYLWEFTSNVQRTYKNAFCTGGLPEESTDLQWMMLYANLKHTTPEYKALTKEEMDRIQEMIAEKKNKESNLIEVEKDEEIVPYLAASLAGAVLGGALGGMIGGQPFSLPGMAAGGVVGAITGYHVYRISLRVISEKAEGQKKKVEVTLEEYEILEDKLESICGKEEARVREKLEEWLDEVKTAALDQKPVN